MVLVREKLLMKKIKKREKMKKHLVEKKQTEKHAAGEFLRFFLGYVSFSKLNFFFISFLVEESSVKNNKRKQNGNSVQIKSKFECLVKLNNK